MASKSKITRTKTITLSEREGTFTTIFHKFKGNKNKNTEVSKLRQILSNEKARMIHIIKTKRPESIYALAKLLKRDFKAVRQDIRVLESFGIIELTSSHKHGRERIMPIIGADQLIITINL